MNSTKTVFAIPAAGVFAAAAIFAGAGPAAAAPDGKFQTIYSLTQGACFAKIDSSVNGDAYPNQAAFTVASTMTGFGACKVDVTLHWRNVDTGATGTFNVTPQGPGFWMNSSYSTLFAPGFGHFTGTVSIGAPSFPASGEVQFDVTQYQG